MCCIAPCEQQSKQNLKTKKEHEQRNHDKYSKHVEALRMQLFFFFNRDCCHSQGCFLRSKTSRTTPSAYRGAQITSQVGAHKGMSLSLSTPSEIGVNKGLKGSTCHPLLQGVELRYQLQLALYEDSKSCWHGIFFLGSTKETPAASNLVTLLVIVPL